MTITLKPYLEPRGGMEYKSNSGLAREIRIRIQAGTEEVFTLSLREMYHISQLADVATRFSQDAAHSRADRSRAGEIGEGLRPVCALLSQIYARVLDHPVPVSWNTNRVPLREAVSDALEEPLPELSTKEVIVLYAGLYPTVVSNIVTLITNLLQGVRVVSTDDIENSFISDSSYHHTFFPCSQIEGLNKLRTCLKDRQISLVDPELITELGEYQKWIIIDPPRSIRQEQQMEKLSSDEGFLRGLIEDEECDSFRSLMDKELFARHRVRDEEREKKRLSRTSERLSMGEKTFLRHAREAVEVMAPGMLPGDTVGFETLCDAVEEDSPPQDLMQLSIGRLQELKSQAHEQLQAARIRFQRMCETGEPKEISSSLQNKQQVMQRLIAIQRALEAKGVPQEDLSQNRCPVQ